MSETGGKADADALAPLRAEIDGIDTEIHDLLMRRTRVVSDIAAAKKAEAGNGAPALAMRPGREAAILRRLAERHEGPLPVGVVCGLWRAIITAKVSLQGPFEVIVAGGDKILPLWDLARAHFGVEAPMRSAGTAVKALAEARGVEGLVVVVPAPEQSDWWPVLASLQTDELRIVARLPFVADDGDEAAGPKAVVVARLAPELIAAERSYVIARLPPGQPVAGFEGRLGEAGLDARVAAMGLEPGGGGRLALLDMAGDMTNDPRLSGGAEGLGDFTVVGGYAEPLLA